MGKTTPRQFTKHIRNFKWLVLVAWLVILVVALPFIGKLNNAVSSLNQLPNSDQAAIVNNIVQKAAPLSSQDELIVVYEKGSGIRTQDTQTILKQKHAIAAASLPKVSGISSVTYSPDNHAAYFSVYANIASSGNTSSANEKLIVRKVRRIVKSSNGLTTATTGQMAIDVDSNSANTDTLLLISAAIIVAILLILTYRSVFLWIVPLFSAILSISLADMIVYALTRHGVQVMSLDSSILIILVFGVATDYGMLLISRYRENLHVYQDKNEAVALALKHSFGAIAASATTVALALLSLLFAAVINTKALGPVAAIGIACAFLVQMTFLPAVLAICGRKLLWPRAPKYEPELEAKTFTGSRLWIRIANVVAKFPRRITAIVTIALLVCALGLTQLTFTVNPTAALRGNPPSMQGQTILDRHFAAVSNAPIIVTGNNAASIAKARQIAASAPGTGLVSPITVLAGHPSISITIDAPAYSNQAYSYIASLRSSYQKAQLSGVNVGGRQATQYDLSRFDKRDNLVLIPVILVIVGLILVLLLRALVIPLLLLVTIVCSFAGSLGISVLIFNHVFHFQGMDPGLLLYIFLFVVALGVDYNIFLMHRARQETVKHGTREGILRSLKVTGGVITAAGLVLAGTFATLAQLPYVELTEVGVAVALGILIDSFLVRSFLVPAAVLTIGERGWWPGKLAKASAARKITEGTVHER
jgi:RND superfamily putative drug exporter